MRSNLRFALQTRAILLSLSAYWLMMSLAFTGAASQQVRFTPKFFPGESLRYQIESRTTTRGKTTTPIADPEGGGSQSKEQIHLIVRLDVLDVAFPAAAAGSVRIRATYEKSSAQSESDAFNPAATALADQYARIEGRSFEFTIGPGGQLANFQGLDEIYTDRSAAQPVVSWLDGIFSVSRLPPNGVEVGQKWKNERPIPGALLSGLTWRTESDYLRNERCNLPSGTTGSGSPPGAQPGACAVILTQFEILRRGSTHTDETPEEYRRNGLRTSGTWTGTGGSLNSISLTSGLLANSTQTSNQEMNYLIISASTGSSIHHVGHVQSETQITLLPDQT